MKRKELRVCDLVQLLVDINSLGEQERMLQSVFGNPFPESERAVRLEYYLILMKVRLFMAGQYDSFLSLEEIRVLHCMKLRLICDIAKLRAIAKKKKRPVRLPKVGGLKSVEMLDRFIKYFEAYIGKV